MRETILNFSVYDEGLEILFVAVMILSHEVKVQRVRMGSFFVAVE